MAETNAAKNFPNAPVTFQNDMANISLDQQAILLNQISDREELRPSTEHAAKLAGVAGYAPARTKGNAAALQRTGSLVTTSPAAAAALKNARTRTPQQTAQLRVAAGAAASNHVASPQYIELLDSSSDDEELLKPPTPPPGYIELLDSSTDDDTDDDAGLMPAAPAAPVKRELIRLPSSSSDDEELLKPLLPQFLSAAAAGSVPSAATAAAPPPPPPATAHADFILGRAIFMLRGQPRGINLEQAAELGKLIDVLTTVRVDTSNGIFDSPAAWQYPQLAAVTTNAFLECPAATLEDMSATDARGIIDTIMPYVEYEQRKALGPAPPTSLSLAPGPAPAVPAAVPTAAQVVGLAVAPAPALAVAPAPILTLAAVRTSKRKKRAPPPATESLPTDTTLRKRMKLANPPALTVGQPVQALFRGQAWAYATIATVHADGQYTVDWDDGESSDREHPVQHIKPRNASALTL